VTRMSTISQKQAVAEMVAAVTGKTTTAPRRSPRGRAPKVACTVTALEFFRKILGLGDGPYDIAVLRVSAVGALAKLSSQEETGLLVYKHNPDFVELGSMERDFAKRGWHEVRYSDIHSQGDNKRLGWVGLVGRTIFLAVSDTAIEANLPPDPDDPAQLGRNAFVQALIAIAVAGNVENIYVPFLSRMWRDNFQGQTIIKSLVMRLPSCTLWNGNDIVKLDGEGQIIVGVGGGVSAAYAMTLKAQVFSGFVKALQRGEWGRTERELPTGLRRVRGDGTKLTKVEMDLAWWPVVVTGLAMLAAGDSYKAIGEFFTEKKLPMSGTKGVGKTYEDYSHEPARIAGVKAAFAPYALSYYRTGRFPVRLNTAAPLEPGGVVRGIPVQWDEEIRKHYWEGEAVLPHQEILTAEQWAKIDARLATEQDTRNRLTGAAAQKKKSTRAAAFQGVPSWPVGEEREAKLAPETDTAYRWRERDRQDRGWLNNEGDATATLCKSSFDRACGQAIIDSLRDLSAPLAPLVLQASSDDPHSELRRHVEQLTAELARATKAIARAQEELLQADDADDQATWRAARKAKKAEAERLTADLAAAEQKLADGVANTVVEHEQVDTDVTLPALVGSLLLDSDGTVDVAVLDAMRKLGITTTVRLAFADPATLPAHKRPKGERGAERWVVATATMTVPLADGDTLDVPLTWHTLDTAFQSGTASITGQFVRQWAAGKTFDEIAKLAASFTAAGVRTRLVATMRKAGMDGWYLPGTAVNCPVLDTRAVIAARVLGDDTLTAGMDPAFITQITEAYFDNGSWSSKLWCDRPGMDDIRRVLAAFAAATPDVWAEGLPTDAVARLTGVNRADIREFARERKVFELSSYHTVKPLLCPQCKVPVSVYNPTPETAPTGLVCPDCTRAYGKPAVLGVEYLRRWVRVDGGQYAEAPEPAVARPVAERDTTLTVFDVAARLKVPAHTVRLWDSDGELVPIRRTSNGNRLYSLAQMDDRAHGLAAKWRDKNGGVEHRDDGLLKTGEAAALLGVSEKRIRSWAKGPNPDLPTADHTDGGHRLFRRCDVDALAPKAQVLSDAVSLCFVGEMAAEFGIKISVLRQLTEDGRVPCVDARDAAGGPGSWRRYDRDAVKAALEQLGLINSQELITIGQLEERSGIRQSKLRAMANSGTLPAVVTPGGTRRFDLTVALAALAAAGFDEDGTERFTCATCNATFVRASKNGPKPRKCEPCQTAARAARATTTR
jgi:DNA-binding transcriptional MerR regulator